MPAGTHACRVAYHGTAMNEPAQRAIQTQLDRVGYLRATGPNPFDYWVWADQTEAMLAQAYGVDSEAAASFRDAVSERGRTADQRGLAGNMTLGLHGDWGIWARLQRGQSVLERLVAQPAAG